MTVQYYMRVAVACLRQLTSIENRKDPETIQEGVTAQYSITETTQGAQSCTVQGM